MRYLHSLLGNLLKCLEGLWKAGLFLVLVLGIMTPPPIQKLNEIWFVLAAFTAMTFCLSYLGRNLPAWRSLSVRRLAAVAGVALLFVLSVFLLRVFVVETTTFAAPKGSYGTLQDGFNREVNGAFQGERSGRPWWRVKSFPEQLEADLSVTPDGRGELARARLRFTTAARCVPRFAQLRISQESVPPQAVVYPLQAALTGALKERMPAMNVDAAELSRFLAQSSLVEMPTWPGGPSGCFAVTPLVASIARAEGGLGEGSVLWQNGENARLLTFTAAGVSPETTLDLEKILRGVETALRAEETSDLALLSHRATIGAAVDARLVVTAVRKM